jgi:hypothetical protein
LKAKWQSWVERGQRKKLSNPAKRNPVKRVNQSPHRSLEVDLGREAQSPQHDGQPLPARFGVFEWDISRPYTHWLLRGGNSQEQNTFSANGTLVISMAYENRQIWILTVVIQQHTPHRTGLKLSAQPTWTCLWKP